MVIDFHTHIFPETLAKRATAALSGGIKENEGIEILPCAEATRGGLSKTMDRCGIDMSIVMPIVTNPEKPGGVNNYAQTVRDDRILSFGSVHPMQKNAADAVRALRERGFIGIKLHPEFQRCYIDSPESIAVLKAAEEEKMLVMLHTGADIGLPPPVHCAPERLLSALDYISGENIIAAHLGGWRMWDTVYERLAGTPVYMDTAFISDYIDADLCREIIKKHGADKILFGSDFPWEVPSRTLEFLGTLGLSSAEEEKIRHGNAKELLRRYGVICKDVDKM